MSPIKTLLLFLFGAILLTSPAFGNHNDKSSSAFDQTLKSHEPLDESKDIDIQWSTIGIKDRTTKPPKAYKRPKPPKTPKPPKAPKLPGAPPESPEPPEAPESPEPPMSLSWTGGEELEDLKPLNYSIMGKSKGKVPKPPKKPPSPKKPSPPKSKPPPEAPEAPEAPSPESPPEKEEFDQLYHHRKLLNISNTKI